MSAHRLPFDLGKMIVELPDPGAGASFSPASWGCYAISTGSSDETTTLLDPSNPFIVFLLYMENDGGGRRYVEADTAFDSSGNTSLIFSDVDDSAALISVPSSSGGYKWNVVYANGANLA